MSMYPNQEVNELAAIMYGPGLLKSLPPGTITKKNCSGKTTSRALFYISEAMRQPNVPVKVVHDHLDSSVMNRAMLGEVEKYIDKLDFMFFQVSKLHNTITFQI